MMNQGRVAARACHVGRDGSNKGFTCAGFDVVAAVGAIMRAGLPAVGAALSGARQHVLRGLGLRDGVRNPESAHGEKTTQARSSPAPLPMPPNQSPRRTSSSTARHCWRRKRRAWCGVATPSVARALSTLRVMRPVWWWRREHTRCVSVHEHTHKRRSFDIGSYYHAPETVPGAESSARQVGQRAGKGPEPRSVWR